jgi:aryl-alcohol dehydrogenase-like predicted oxidoreductase
MSAPPADTRIEEAGKRGWGESWDLYANEHTWQVIDQLVAIASEVQKTPAQVALNWLLQKPVVTAPIIGARSLTHLNDNLGATGWSLTVEQVTRLDQAGDSPLPYPYESLVQQRISRGR